MKLNKQQSGAAAWLAPRQNRILHLTMALVGGFLGSYALLLRGGNFGNAQTGNLLEMMLDLTQGGWLDLLRRVGAMAIFAAALVLSTLLTNHSRVNMAWLCLGVEGVGLAVTALVPGDVHPVVALYPIFFLSAFQWGTFSGAEGYGCATIFSTNNFRQAVTGWTEWLVAGDPEQRRKAGFYTATVCAFLLGGLAGGWLSGQFQTYASLFGLIPLAFAALVLILGDGKFSRG